MLHKWTVILFFCTVCIQATLLKGAITGNTKAATLMGSVKTTKEDAGSNIIQSDIMTINSHRKVPQRHRPMKKAGKQKPSSG
ncbi:hypothetical protein ACROYT_G016383 [Oculina patagonica]